MRHLLMDPAFPDIVGEWAAERDCQREPLSRPAASNDDHPEDMADTFLTLLGRLEIDATRVW